MLRKSLKRKSAKAVVKQTKGELIINGGQTDTDNEVNNSKEETEDFLQNIKDAGNDSTDDEGIGEIYESDDSDELQFESDDEGNYNARTGPWRPYNEQYSGDDEDDDDDGDDDDGDNLTETNALEAKQSETKKQSKVSENSKLQTNPQKLLGNEKQAKQSNLITPKTNKSLLKKVEPTKTATKQSVRTIKLKTKLPQQTVVEVKNVEKVENSLPAKSKPPKKKLTKKRIVENSSHADYLEYKNSDTSDEEDIRNTVGNIPMHWYDEYKHIGYDWDAKKIIKPVKGDQIDDFLRKIEDPNFWRTVKDPQTGQEVLLTDADIELIKRINSARIPNPDHNEYAPWIEWFTGEVEKFPIKNVPDHKRSFLPSVSEKKRIGRMVHALKMGWMKTIDELQKERKAKRELKFYMLWESDTAREKMRRIHDHVAAPKRDLPGHAESYNPPPEYLFDEREKHEWLKLEEEPHKRKLHFMPQQYNSLREVPAYPRYMRERFLRCLDLYLCPRARRVKLNIDAEYLIPKLPSPRDLQPFPTVESMVYCGHTDFIRSISIEPKGEYLVSGSDDKTIKIWEIATGRCIRTIETDDVVRCVAWCPNIKLSIIAAASGNCLLLINPKVGDKLLIKKTDDLMAEVPQIDTMETERVKTAVEWSVATGEQQAKGVRLIIKHFKPIRQVTWHGRGDYFATVMPEGANRSTLIHQLSKRRSQIPFAKSKGLVQCVLFHPIKPCLFVATQHNVRIYDLVKQELVKKLLSNSKWISGMSLHPKGDNLLVSTYDKKMLWFDLDLSTKPYQTMRLHKGAVRNIAYHLRYPLFASASDDRTVIVSHGMVYNDLLQNPLIVPLKKLNAHAQVQEFGALDVVWHPFQPWIFSSGADTTVRLFT